MAPSPQPSPRKSRAREQTEIAETLQSFLKYSITCGIYFEMAPRPDMR
jgi:hypothetical protein